MERNPLQGRPLTEGTIRPTGGGSAGIAAGVVLALLLGWLALATDPWRDDEAYTWYMAGRSLAANLREIVRGDDPHPPLYYWIASLSRSAWDSPRLLQAIGVLFAAGGAGLLACVTRRLWGARAGVIAGLLLGAFPMLAHQGQEMRMYAAAFFFEAGALAGWAYARRWPRAGWACFALCGIAGLYTNGLYMIFLAMAAPALLAAAWLQRGLSEGRRIAPGPVWTASALLAIGAAYLPWLPIVLRQSTLATLNDQHSSPPWPEALRLLSAYPWFLDVVSAHWSQWVAGGTLLWLLPLAFASHLTLRRGRWRERSAGLAVSWIAFAPILLLTLYAMERHAIAEFRRHPVLFLPFPLMLSGAWLARLDSAFARRIIVPVLLATTIGGACFVLARPRDPDLRPLIDKIIANAPPGEPIVMYPPVPDFRALMMHPLKLHPYHGAGELTSMTRVVLAVTPDFGNVREDIILQVYRTLAEARSIKTIVEEPGLLLYLADGLPPGSLDALMGRLPWQGIEQWKAQAGKHAPPSAGGPDRIAAIASPAGEEAAFSQTNKDWRGMRLIAPKTTLALPALAAGASPFAVQLVGGAIPAEMQIDGPLRLDSSYATTASLDQRYFMLARLVAAGEAPAPWRIAIPASGIGDGSAAGGDVPRGVYLTWIAAAPLDYAALQSGGETLIDVGAPGDEAFLRGGFHGIERAPPDGVRWTAGRFAAEVPVFPGHPVRHIVLHGAIPAQIKGRGVRVRLTPVGTGGAPIETSRVVVESDYRAHVFDLPVPVAPGIHLLEVALEEAWVPARTGDGYDTRELGVYLNAIGLRE